MIKLTRRQIPHLGRRRKHHMDDHLSALSEDMKKDQNRTLRFKRKSYGRGWTPASRQGRVVLTVYLLLIGGRVIRYSRMAQQDQQQWAGTALEAEAGGNLVVALVPVFVLTLVLLIICYKTGETPKWQRGQKKQ